VKCVALVFVIKGFQGDGREHQRSHLRALARHTDVRLIVFGASGGTGHELVVQALAQGRQVTAFVRNPARLNVRSLDLHVTRGDVTNAPAVKRAIHGQHAVLCALGAATPLRRDTTLIEGVQHIVDAMTEYGTKRLVYLSFLGVREGRRQLSFIGRTVVAPLLLRNVVADHEAKERIIQRSQVNWVIVRPPRLTNGPRTGDYRHGVDIRATSMIPRISRADVADFMLRQMIDDTYVHRSPAVMY
jgi:putative NADH-flavin reductase